MVKRWVIAAGAALALVFLALLEAPSFLMNPFDRSDEPEASTTCEADARPAPMDFVLQDMNGSDVNLESFKGNVILLNFWATWCGPCKVEIPGFVELQDEYRDQGFIVLGLSIDDTADQIKPFAEHFKVNYPMLVGLGRDDFQTAYGPVWGIPISFWIDRKGTLCKTHIGFATKEHFERDLNALL